MSSRSRISKNTLDSKLDKSPKECKSPKKYRPPLLLLELNDS